MRKLLTQLSLCLATWMMISQAYAGVVITGTRVIYPADEKNISVRLSNQGKKPVLVKSWIDQGEKSQKPDTIRVPFTLTPPLNRIDPGRGQTLRISALSPSLPTDRESIFWLNVMEIPPKPQELVAAGENYLQVAFRSRIKMFYRPAGLNGSANQAGKELVWTKTASGIKATNNSPYFVSLTTVVSGNKKVTGEMIPPLSSREFAITPAGNISYSYINDFGSSQRIDASVR